MPTIPQGAAPKPRSAWRRWLPPRVRQQALLIATSLTLLLATLVLLGTTTLRPISFSRTVHEPPAISENIAGAVDLFDLAVPHTLTITISAAEYQKLVDDFRKDGSKTWIRADATLDGTLIPSVGIRLKGNSTLAALRPRGAFGLGFGGPPPGAEIDAGTRPNPAPRGPPGGMSNATFDDPSTLPLLLSFSKFVRGRGYQGRSELAIRPSSADGANLNEALALQLIADSGQTSQRYTWVAFRLNDGEPRTRLAVESPDASYAESLGQGALYKSTSTNRFTYLGEDQTAYTDDFSQESARGSLGLAPVINLLQFIRDADDARFAAELPRWLDTASFARYVATHDLLDNFDDMAGPGRNFLLWYAAADDRLRVLTWDMNLAIVGMPGGGPGGRGGPPGGRPPGPPPGAPGDPTKRGMQHGNPLKQRFVAAPAFADLRAEARSELANLWFHSGRAAALARELAAHIPRTRTGDDARIERERSSLLTSLERLTTRAAQPPTATP